MTVALIKFDGSLDSLRQAIELCDGFGKLGKSDKVLVKPNNCFRHRVMPPYGMVTTSWIVEGVVQLLLEYGCYDISVGEGSIVGIFDELSPYTKRGFEGTAIAKLAKKYGVKLIDFNQGAFHDLDLEGIKIHVSRAALDADFLINIPVLKTHFQAKASLGFKNLKGCLSQDSKRRFHISKRLDNLICLLNEAIKSDLVIIDGIYMLEKGPETLAGVAHRKDVIIASPDVFECDVVGATILGIDPAQVDYLKEFAERHGRSFDINTIQIKGEDIQSLKEQLEWRFEPDKELLSPAKVTGLSAPYPGQTLCSACGATLALALAIFGNDNPEMDFGGVELYYGLGLKPENDTRKVLLYGDCAIKSSKSLRNAIKIEGCPPSLSKTLFALMKSLLSKPRMLRMLLLEAIRLVGIRLGLRYELLPGWERYQAREFEKRHF
ncbi:MAG: DUF362 domain-containing protein [Dehalococcoidia bacterium]